MIKQEKWEIRVPEGSNGWVYITRHNGLYKEEVCTIHGKIRGIKKEGELVDSVAMQDARMIAAAPVMYAILREFYVEEYELPRLQKLIDVLNLVEGNAEL